MIEDVKDVQTGDTSMRCVVCRGEKRYCMPGWGYGSIPRGGLLGYRVFRALPDRRALARALADCGD